MSGAAPQHSSSPFGATATRNSPVVSEMTTLRSPRVSNDVEEQPSDGSPMSSSGAGQRVKIVADYALQQRLGSGSFAVVYKGVRVPRSRAVHETVAVKAISRTSEKLTKKVLQNLEIEINILRSYRHRNIVCMHDVQKTEHHFYLILEYCGGGDVQKLIRTRQKLRLTEGLTRRLMRDLASGLRFLWGQELIHRDIKPQNLLLTGLLPLDEVHDPAKTEELEQKRRDANFPSEQFALKIADFGFARHLQSASLAETLCGSPLYMAPEILQHHRYDAKADLWSVGTVLFEMITGQPPFHGENQFDLLRNIQRKAVRLPPDVRVSSECVSLLRILLNRNPLSRAGFKEFFDACDAFVALGCNGSATQDDGAFFPQTAGLGSIPEDASSSPASESANMQHRVEHVVEAHETAPVAPAPPSSDYGRVSTESAATGVMTRTSRGVPSLVPLVPSPPSTAPSPIYSMSALKGTTAPQRPTLWQAQQQNSDLNSMNRDTSSEENSFVMVEHSSMHRSVSGGALAYVSGGMDSYHPVQPLPSPPAPPSPSYYFPRNPTSSSRGEYMVVRQPKGMLSTSPGTGGALMGLLSGRTRLVQAEQASNARQQIEARLANATKLLAVSEDVGRRAISVAHLGDQRAYAAMRLLFANDSSSSSSVVSFSRMEGIEEEADGIVTDDSACMDAATTSRRRRSSSATDKSMPDNKVVDEVEEMPFALSPEPTAPSFSASVVPKDSSSKGATITGSRTLPKATPATIRAYFSEALTCYLKALKMLKGAIAASQNVAKELEALASSGAQPAQLQKMTSRCELTSNWLGGQFRGVLERGDATNAEIAKLSASIVPDQEGPSAVSVEELMFKHAIGYGREGAVKQLLGQFEPARSCYRTAGLLAETLLMESTVGADDRKVLEEYVDGFAARIHELDTYMLQQSRSAASGHGSVGSPSTKVVPMESLSSAPPVPAPSVVSLVGQPFAAPK